jgi:hypothetical protein
LVCFFPGIQKIQERERGGEGVGGGGRDRKRETERYLFLCSQACCPIILGIRVVWRWRWVQSNDGMDLTGVYWSTWRKSYLSANFCTTNPNGMVRDQTQTSFVTHR